MQKRKYHQLCPVAYALDVVGERWTLLIIRDLLYGHRRFSDLINGLPGIGTNLLSNRLKKLETSGIIVRRALAPPVASTVYELSERGRSLGPVVGALASWGTRLLEGIEDEDFLGTMPMLGSLSMLFIQGSSLTRTITEFRTAKEVFYAIIDKGRISVSQGESITPDVVVYTETRELLTLLGHPEKAAKALKQQRIEIMAGSIEAFEKFLKSFYSVEQAATHERG